MKREEYFEDDLRISDWLGEVVDIADPLKDGRIKVKVFGKFDELDNKFIPWARPYIRLTAGSKSGSGYHSVPKLGSIVGVSFDNGNIYEPEYHCNQHISDDLKSEIENSYENAHSIIYDTVTDGSVKVFFTEDKGLMFDYKSTQINIKNDKSIFITNPNGDIIELKNDGNCNVKLKKDIKIECQNATVIASKKAKVDSPKIELGKNATEAVIKGNTFQTLFNSHQHLVYGIPTTPPIIPLTGTELSQITKTQ